MNLTFSSSSKADLTEFIQRKLYGEIRNAFVSILDETELERFDEYLNSSNILTPNIPTNKKFFISTKNILIGALNNLIFIKQPVDNSYIIEISPNEYIPNFNAKFIDIANLVNYGTISIQAYPIFDKVFDSVAKKLHQIYKDYLEGAE